MSANPRPPGIRPYNRLIPGGLYLLGISHGLDDMGINTNFHISLLTEDSTSIADKSCSFAKSLVGPVPVRR